MSENYYGNSGDIYDHAGRSIEPDDAPDGMPVFSIVSRWTPGTEGPGQTTLHVDLASVTEMHFELALKPGDDYERAIGDICRLAPHLLRLDADLMEAYDDAFRTQPKKADLAAVEEFVTRWRSRLRNSNVVAGAFARVQR